MLLIVIALLACGNWNRQAVLRRRQRTRGIRRVRARRVLRTIEVEYHFTRLRQTMIGQRRVEKTSRSVSFRLAGGVAKDKEEVFVLGTFHDRFQPIGLTVE